MSTKTKSFFDQNHTNKSRPSQWQRNQTKAPLSEKSTNVAVSKRPIPATSESRSKLKAFQFVPGKPGDVEDAVEKENVTDHGQEVATSEALEKLAAASAAAAENEAQPVEADTRTSNSAPELPTAQAFPCTPGTRLPLEELIGNFDEHAKKPEPEHSPEEHIGWEPNSSSDKLSPSRRKRKRAQSSSPSSCPNTSSQHRNSGGTAAQAEQVTTEADPALDLWQKYGAEKQTDGEAKLPGLHDLIFQGSPRALETPAKSAGLRRWASTGNDWPTSKTKRRRTNANAPSHLWQDVQAGDSDEKSKFADLLKKVEESLATQRLEKEKSKPAVRIEGPSSSSPLPEVGALDAFDRIPTASPLQTKQPAAQSNATDAAIQREAPKVPRIASRQSLATNRELAAYGHNKLTPVPDSVNVAPLYLSSKAPLPAYKRPSITRTPSDGARQRQSAQTAVTAKPPVNPELDEFGDDFDLTAEDLEELVTRPPPLDQRPLHQIPAHPNPPPQQSLEEVEQHHQQINGGCAAQPIQLDDDDDEFGMDDIDEASFAQAEVSATQAFRILPKKRKTSKKSSQRTNISPNVKSSEQRKGPLKHLQRYVVKQVVDGEYTNARGRQCPEKVLISEEYRSNRTTAITIRDSWVSTSVSPGNTIHVAHILQPSPAAPPSSPPGQITISDTESSPLLIVHPDHMLSATTVADSFDCIRKAVLQDRIKATGETSKAMVYGKILHEIFQQALSANCWDDTFLTDLVQRTVQNHVEGLWELGMQDTVLAVEEISAKMCELASWARIFVAENPSEVAVVDDKQGEKIWMTISKLIAIEEHVWSPRYGLKGNIDATIQATVLDNPKEPSKRLIAPFEVKTGRTTQSPAHRAQTALYTL